MSELVRPGIDRTPRVDVADRYGILVVVTMPQENFAELGLPSYEEWFGKALGVNPNRVTAVSAITGTLPKTIPQSGVIIGGSSHSTYEGLPWMKNLEEFIRATADQEKPMLGVCFGHQMIAQALGGAVEKGNNGREFGSADITLTDAGRTDPLFDGLPNTLSLATSHSDVVTRLPRRGDVAVLANNDMYSNQSLKVGDKIRTIQPHPEITCDIIGAIADSRKDALTREGFFDRENYEEFMANIRRKDIEAQGRQVLRNFDRGFIAPHAQQ